MVNKRRFLSDHSPGRIFQPTMMTTTLTVAVLLLYHVPFGHMADVLLNECDRGVKRPHPSQANVYQLFARRNLMKQWIDYRCEKYMIFDPRLCTCVERHGTLSTGKAPTFNPPQFDKNDKRINNDRERQLEEVVPRDGTRGEKTEKRGVDDDDRWVNRRDEGKPVPRSSERGQGERRSLQIEQITNKGIIYENPQVVSDQEKGDYQEPNCHLHQPSSDDASHFERWTDGQWVVEDCNFPFYTGLVWNQEKCRCEWGTNRSHPIAIQENVVPATCLMMLQMSFDDGEIIDEGRGVWMHLQNKDDAAAVVDGTAIGGYSGYFRGASITIPFFKSNIIGPIFHIGFMFKLCPGNPDTDIFLVHNDCKESFDGASLVVSYQAWKQQIILAMRTVESDVPQQEYCTISSPGPQGRGANWFDNHARLHNYAFKSWVKVDIRYEDNYMEMLVNDEVCISTNKFKGPMATNNCPLTLLGESFCGQLDEVIITRGCTDQHAIS